MEEADCYRPKGNCFIYSQALVGRMLALGLGPHWDSHTKRMPPAVFTASAREVGALLRGYFSGDGAVVLRPRTYVEATSVNRHMVEDVQTLLDRMGIRSIVTPNRRRDGRLYYQVRISWPNSFNRFFRLVGFLNKRPMTKGSRRTDRRDTSCRGIRRVAPVGERPAYIMKTEADGVVVGAS